MQTCEGSTFWYAVQEKKIQVIPDIEHELLRHERARFKVMPDGAARAKGSLSCYPVISTDDNTVRLVISVYCQEPRVFHEESEAFYEHVLYALGAHMLTAQARGGRAWRRVSSRESGDPRKRGVHD